MIWILVVIYVVILALEVPPLVRDRLYPELGTFAVMFAIGLYMSLAFYYEWPLTVYFQAIINSVQMGME